jgi:hypothetical protein
MHERPLKECQDSKKEIEKKIGDDHDVLIKIDASLVPIRLLVYGFAGIILSGVVIAILSIVLRKP